MRGEGGGLYEEEEGDEDGEEEDQEEEEEDEREGSVGFANLFDEPGVLELGKEPPNQVHDSFNGANVHLARLAQSCVLYLSTEEERARHA